MFIRPKSAPTCRPLICVAQAHQEGKPKLEAERGHGEANRRRGRRISPDAGQDGHGGDPPTRDSLSRSAPSVVSRPRTSQSDNQPPKIVAQAPAPSTMVDSQLDRSGGAPRAPCK